MIGIQKNTVIGYSGKIKGELLNTYYQGNDSSFPFTAMKSVIVKEIQAFNDMSTPAGLAKMIIVKNDSGALVKPSIPTGNLGSMAGGSGFYEILLFHNEGANVIQLRLMNRQTGSEVVLCTWEDSELINEPSWAYIIDTVHMVVSTSAKEFHMAMVVTLDESTQYKKCYHIKLTVRRDDVTNSISVEQSGAIYDLPAQSLGWRTMYSYIAENYPEAIRINGAENAAFVPMSSNEREIVKLNERVDNLDIRLNSVETSANSRYVSR